MKGIVFFLASLLAISSQTEELQGLGLKGKLKQAINDLPTAQRVFIRHIAVPAFKGSLKQMKQEYIQEKKRMQADPLIKVVLQTNDQPPLKQKENIEQKQKEQKEEKTK